MIVYFNGKYIEENKVSLSIKDRGFLLGDGIFETILYKNKKLIFFDLHTKRLKKSLKRIFINFIYCVLLKINRFSSLIQAISALQFMFAVLSTQTGHHE